MFDTSNDWDEEGENSQEKQQKITGIEVKTSDNETKKFPGQENIQVKEMETSLISKEEKDTPENEEGKSLIEGVENTQNIEEETPLNEKELNILDKTERKSLNQEEEKTQVTNGENTQEKEDGNSFTKEENCTLKKKEGKYMDDQEKGNSARKEEKNTLDKDEENSLTNEAKNSMKKEEGRFLMKKEDKLGLEKKKEKDEAASFNMVGSKSFYYKQRWRRTQLELFLGSLLHLLINLLLLCPIIFIGKVD